MSSTSPPGSTGLEQLQRAYDADADRRAALEPDAWRLDVVDGLARRLRPGARVARVVDLGCGAGQLARRLLDLGVEVVGIDLSPAMVEAARRRGVDARTGDLRDLPFDDATFDGALAFNSLVHTPRRALPAVFREVRRVLRAGAPFQVVVWGGQTYEGLYEDDWLDPPRFFSMLSDDDLLALDTPGFDRHDVRFLHEHVVGQSHPQVLSLTAADEVEPDGWD